MNERDLMNKINEKTKNLQIPESITPEHMKKMLDETLQNQNTNTTSGSPEKNNAGKRNRYIRRFTAAACIVLVLAGGIGITINRKNLKTTDTASEAFTSGKDTSDTESKSFSDTEDSDSGFGSDLAYQTKFQTPASYEEYFNTVKDTYDAYYNSISTVEKGDVVEENVGETNSYDGGDSDMVTYSAEDSLPEIAAESSMDTAAVNRASMTAKSGSKESGSNTAVEDYSKTNTQEKDIDEGDIIKTDGTYIYRLTNRFDNNTGDDLNNLTITRTENGKLTLESTIDLSELSSGKEDVYADFHEFYYYNDQLFVLYSENDYTTDSQGKNMTYIAVYNVKHREKPELVKKLSQSGWYEDSRISGGYLYTITNYNECEFTNIKRYKDYIPTVDDNTISCDNIYYTNDILMDSAHVVTSLDLKKPTEFTDSKSIQVSGSSVYVSDKAIYFYAAIYDDVTKTEIMKMYYEDGKFTVGGSAVIAGYLYGPFAINEYDGYLRVVAIIPANNISLLRNVITEEDFGISDSGKTKIREDVNTLYILDDNLNLTGKLTGIAPGETIYSARFIKDTGYFVTYKNTDPLFSVDLSDPENPVILCELELPGFSNYLHPYGKETLFGLGEETDPKTQEFKGIKLSMFDISNPENVTETDKYIIENSWYSNAQYDYKAIMIDPEKNIFGFLYYAVSGNDSNNEKYYYATYTYDEETGFEETAKYVIDDGSEYETDGVRGVYIGDYLYICTNRQIVNYKLNSEEQLDKVVFDATRNKK